MDHLSFQEQVYIRQWQMKMKKTILEWTINGVLFLEQCSVKHIILKKCGQVTLLAQNK